MNRALVLTALAAGLVFTALVVRGQEQEGGDVTTGASARFDRAFWQRWSDGHAELAGYELTFTRYGEARKGTAVSIFVTEPFSEEDRVKADPGKHAEEDVFQVMKLNLVQDFPTGVYDYNLMTSCFVGLEPSGGRGAGEPAKLTFSSQEWCGHVFHQLLFDRGGVREVRHSYFDGEEGSQTLPTQTGGISEDALFHWARDMAGPALEPGAERRVPLLVSAQHARLNHVGVTWTQATLSRSADTQEVTVPAGTFEVDVYAAKIDGGRTWTFHVERASPRRIVQWACSSGHEARLVRSERMKYWELHDSGDEATLKKLGLSPRPPRTP